MEISEITKLQTRSFFLQNVPGKESLIEKKARNLPVLIDKDAHGLVRARGQWQGQGGERWGWRRR